MTDGWTSGSGLGLGLSGAKRLVNEFDIETGRWRGHPRHDHALEVTLAPQVRIAVSDASEAGEARRAATRMAKRSGSTSTPRRGRDRRHRARHEPRPACGRRATADPGARPVRRTARWSPLDRRGPGDGRHPALPAGRILHGRHAGHRPRRRAAAGERLRHALDRRRRHGGHGPLRRPAAGPAPGSRRRRATNMRPSRFRRRTSRSAAMPGGSPSAMGPAPCWWSTASAMARSRPRPRPGRRRVRRGAVRCRGGPDRAGAPRPGRTRGAALAVAQIGAGVRYAGVGNISGVLTGGERSRGLATQNGTVGLQMRKVQQFDYEWPSRGLLIMHSDGISNRWRWTPILASRSGIRPSSPACCSAISAAAATTRP